MSLSDTEPEHPEFQNKPLGSSKNTKKLKGVDGAVDLKDYLPSCLKEQSITQQLIPSLAKNTTLLEQVENAVKHVPSTHHLWCHDATKLEMLQKNSVHLVVTSPPYWTLKEYENDEGQLGHIADYQNFHKSLNKVWKGCYDALVPGGRLICVVGDVCLSRRQNKGVHEVIPLHASIQENCRKIGFNNLTPIIWHKIANAVYEADGNGGGFLGKPYEPNAVIKNDIEFILMLRKPGGYRSPSEDARLLSIISAENHRNWFQQIWTGITGESTRSHPAPYPTELAERLVRMFSFVGDTVLDPFAGTGTTALASARWGRNSVNTEISPLYFDLASKRLVKEFSKLHHSTLLLHPT